MASTTSMADFLGIHKLQSYKEAPTNIYDVEQPQFSLIHVGKHTGPENAADTSQIALLEGIALGLLHPSVPLSDQAVVKLRLQQTEAGLGVFQHNAGDLLRSLPVELLYDDPGLQLFDQVTMQCSTVCIAWPASLCSIE